MDTFVYWCVVLVGTIVVVATLRLAGGTIRFYKMMAVSGHKEEKIVTNERSPARNTANPAPNPPHN
jgi:hypothetical protein